MPGRWTSHKNGSLKRDLLRDYCLASLCLEEQFARFNKSGVISFAIISETLGNDYNKGLLWRVKDTAHHLFKENGGLPRDDGMLDWAIGFLFHECLQVMESAYQLQYYVPKLADISLGDGNLPDRLSAIAGQSRANLAGHIDRAGKLMKISNELFCRYLSGESENKLLARLVYDRESLLRQVFGPLYPQLVASIYGAESEKAPLGAARSLAESGQTDKATQAVMRALGINKDNSEAQALLLLLKQKQAAALKAD